MTRWNFRNGQAPRSYRELSAQGYAELEGIRNLEAQWPDGLPHDLATGARLARLETAWARILTALEPVVSESALDLWLRTIWPVAWTDGVLWLAAPANRTGWLRDRFLRLLTDTARRELGVDLLIRLVPSPPVPERKIPPEESARRHDSPGEPRTLETPSEGDPAP